jgi:hypothetical protein
LFEKDKKIKNIYLSIDMESSKVEEEKKGWLEALSKVRTLTSTNIDVKLTFNQDESPISLSMTYNSINVAPQLLECETSMNFKMFALIHEIVHLLNLRGKIPYEYLCHAVYYEKEANRSTYEILINNYGRESANRIVIDFITDRVTLGKKIKFVEQLDSREKFKKYIEKYFPFLPEEVKNSLFSQNIIALYLNV